MAFKIKDGIRIGTVDVFNSSGVLLVKAPTADAWTTARTITLGGDLTGNVSVDGSQNVTLTATIAADSVALGTDTTGNYAASVAAGDGITVTGTAGEGTAFTVAHTDTSTQANVTNTGNTFIQSLTFDTFGHVTGATSAALTETDTLSSVTGRGATTSSAISITNNTASTSITTGALVLTGGVGVGGNIYSGGDVVIDANGKELKFINPAKPTMNAGIYSSIGGSSPDIADPATVFYSAGSVFLQPRAGSGGTLFAFHPDFVDGNDFASFPRLSLTGTADADASTSTTTGALKVAGGVGVGGALNVGGNVGVGGTLTVTGDLIINGTTTTVNSTTTTLDDPILTLGGDTAPATDDSKDRGVEFRWHNGTSAKIGFFGYDDSTGKFTFIPDATNTSEVFSGTKGELDAKVDWSNILNTPSAQSVNDGTLTLTASAGGTGTSVTIGTGTGFSANDLSNETYDIDVGPALSNLATAMTGAGSGFLKKNGQDTYVLDTNTYITAETDTLATVTGRSATTSVAISITNSTESTTSATGALIVSGGVAAAKTITTKAGVALHNSSDAKISDTSGTSATVASTSITDVDTWAIATYRSARYLVQITQGTNYQVSEVLVIHNGTTTTMTEYAVLETNGALCTLTSDVNSGNARLRVTMGSATSATIKVHRTLITV